MPVFDTPQPITATVDVVVGDVRVTASDRVDTVVEVRPSNPGADLDVRAAADTRVDFTDGRLLVKAPRQPVLGLFGKSGSVDVEVQLPTGSRLHGDASVASFRGAGRLGECRVKNSTGDILLESTGPLDASTPSGAVVVGSVSGQATVSGSGDIRIDEIRGDAVLKNLNGHSWIGSITGALKARAANGDIVVGHAGADVSASSANGDVRIGEVTAGVVSIKTANGELEVGVPAGTAAYLDLSTSFGNVQNRLETTAAPGQGERTVEVRARNSYGDIIIRRP
jgi:hypothetical protein